MPQRRSFNPTPMNQPQTNAHGRGSNGPPEGVLAPGAQPLPPRQPPQGMPGMGMPGMQGGPAGPGAMGQTSPLPPSIPLQPPGAGGTVTPMNASPFMKPQQMPHAPMEPMGSFGSDINLGQHNGPPSNRTGQSDTVSPSLAGPMDGMAGLDGMGDENDDQMGGSSMLKLLGRMMK